MRTTPPTKSSADGSPGPRSSTNPHAFGIIIIRSIIVFPGMGFFIQQHELGLDVNNLINIY